MRSDHLLNPDKAMTPPDGKIMRPLAEVGRQCDQTWQPLGYLHAGEQLTLLRILDHHCEVQTQVRDERERTAAIKGERREDREDLLMEELGHPHALDSVQIRHIQQVDALLRQAWQQVVEQQLALLLDQRQQSLAHRLQLLRGRKPVGRLLLHARANLLKDTAHADHKELVEV